MDISLIDQVQGGGYIEKWEEYWQGVAEAIARKSKDPKCQVGAVIVHDDVLLATGFNGLARQVFDDSALLADAGEKLKWICHAEQNAIFNAARRGVKLEGATLYVTKFPCLACCNAIIQAGIKVIHTHDSKYWDDDPADGNHSRKKSVLHQAKIEVQAPFHPDYMPKRVTRMPLQAARRVQSELPLPSPPPASPSTVETLGGAERLGPLPPRRRGRRSPGRKTGT